MDCLYHPGRRARARGMCSRCYSRELRRSSRPPLCTLPEYESAKHRGDQAEMDRLRREYGPEMIARSLKLKAERKAAREKRKQETASQRLERRRKIYRKCLYGITPEEYDKLFHKQNGCCALCKLSKPLVVDHDHETDTVRALLCHGCNTALGYVERNGLTWLHAVVSYLEKHGSVVVAELYSRNQTEIVVQ